MLILVVPGLGASLVACAPEPSPRPVDAPASPAFAAPSVALPAAEPSAGGTVPAPPPPARQTQLVEGVDVDMQYACIDELAERLNIRAADVRVTEAGMLDDGNARVMLIAGAIEARCVVTPIRWIEELEGVRGSVVPSGYA